MLKIRSTCRDCVLTSVWMNFTKSILHVLLWANFFWNECYGIYFYGVFIVYKLQLEWILRNPLYVSWLCANFSCNKCYDIHCTCLHYVQTSVGMNVTKSIIRVLIMGYLQLEWMLRNPFYVYWLWANFSWNECYEIHSTCIDYGLTSVGMNVTKSIIHVFIMCKLQLEWMLRNPFYVYWLWANFSLNECYEIHSTCIDYGLTSVGINVTKSILHVLIMG